MSGKTWISVKILSEIVILSENCHNPLQKNVIKLSKKSQLTVFLCISFQPVKLFQETLPARICQKTVKWQISDTFWMNSWNIWWKHSLKKSIRKLSPACLPLPSTALREQRRGSNTLSLGSSYTWFPFLAYLSTSTYLRWIDDAPNAIICISLQSLHYILGLLESWYVNDLGHKWPSGYFSTTAVLIYSDIYQHLGTTVQKLIQIVCQEYVIYLSEICQKSVRKLLIAKMC